MTVALVLVGESNPYSSDPRYALYDEPRGATGDRLRRLVMGVSRRTYLTRFARHDLVHGRWSIPEARDSAARLHEPYPDPIPFVLLGRRVALAFGVAHAAPFTRVERYLVLPHPSGLCREWHAPGAFERARGLLREAIPEIAWGELEAVP
jgi:hypothetical protein